MKFKKSISLIIAAVMIMCCFGAVSASTFTVPGSGLISMGDEDPVFEARYNFIDRLYDLSLGRHPSWQEVDAWMNVLNNTGTGVSVAYGFIYSSEFQNKDVSNEEYVRLMYRMFFGREADAAGLQGWVNVINEKGKTAGRLDVFNGFANSDEFFNLCKSYRVLAGSFVPDANIDQVAKTNRFVDRLYDVVLGRSCDKQGMINWTNALLSGQTTGAEAAYGFFFSPEYTNIPRTYDAYVRDLYRAFMGRNPDSAGLNAWVGVLEGGGTKANVFNGFSQSPEFGQICSDYGINRGGTIDESSAPNTGLIGDSNSGGGNNGNTTPTFNTHNNGGQINVWSWNEEVPGLIEAYSDVTINYTTVDSVSYRQALDATLASGNNAPDIFAADADYAHNYVNNSLTIPVSSVGITSSDLAGMYDYTVSFATDSSGAVKGVAWMCCPSVVFYNRTLASRTLGVSSPEQVAPYFATWSDFMSAARRVNTASNGTVKIVAGPQDVYRSIIAGQQNSWVSGGTLHLDQSFDDLLSITRALVRENLTANESQWSEAWCDSMSDGTVLSYWGPMWLGKFSMGLDPSVNGEYTNPTSGNWGVVREPTASFWGGTWLFVSTYCSNRSLAGQILRDVALDTDNLNAMARGGEFVNNEAVMSSFASNSSFNMSWLGGQNPYGVMDATARSINPSYSYNPSDVNFDALMVAEEYGEGEFSSAQNATDVFVSILQDQGII